MSQREAVAVRDNLRREAAVLADLVAVAQAQREAVLADDSERLAALAREMDRLNVEQHALEQERTAEIRALAADHRTEPTLMGLLPLVEPELREELLALRQRLLDSAARLQILNRANTALIRRALALSQRRLRTLQGERVAPYTAGGVLARPAQRARAWSA